MVAITVMALIAILSWRGLDGMSRAQTQTQARSDAILVLQAGLAQWKADLDAMADGPQISSLDWDGRVLRITRRGSAGAADGLRVAAWTRRSGADGGWLRWQSPALTTLGDWQTYWAQAQTWAQNAGDEDKKREVAILPLDEWQIFYFRGGAWSNPLSSDDSPTVGSKATLPEGIRLMLTLPPTQPISGILSVDWVRATVGGGKS
jgi:general secretion pathway protein J